MFPLRTSCSRRPTGDLTRSGRRRPERDGDRLHLQPLPLCEGGDRPARRRRARPDRGRNRLRRDMLQRRGGAIRRNSFDRMKAFAKAHAFPFPYLHDESQKVARAYGAVCTPDFFGYDHALRLKYRGRLDEGRTTPSPAGRPPRACRSHARNRRRPRARRANPLDRLLDQVEVGGWPAEMRERAAANCPGFLRPWARRAAPAGWRRPETSRRRASSGRR